MTTASSRSSGVYEVVGKLVRPWAIDVHDVVRPDRGTNNLVWFVNKSFVLRVYENLELSRVEDVHRFVDALTGLELPFNVPAPIPTQAGEEVVPTPLGPAALYPLLPGVAASHSESDLELVGSALAHLMQALGTLPAELSPTDWRRPLDQIHAAVPDIDELVADLRTVAPDARGLDVLHSRWSEVDGFYLGLDLPSQICHSDMSPANVLVDHDRVTGVLDFEVAGWDLRVCDFVAGLEQSTEDADGELAFHPRLPRALRTDEPGVGSSADASLPTPNRICGMASRTVA